MRLIWTCAVLHAVVLGPGVRAQAPVGLSLTRAAQAIELPSALKHQITLDGRVLAPRQEASDRRSPGLAALVSLGGGFLGVHGLGSYYAGHSNHGTRHLLLGFGTAGLVIAGLTACGGPFYAAGCGAASGTVVTLGALGYLANWGWSVLAAAGDARIHNARDTATGRGAEQRFVVFPERSVSARPLDVQVLRVTF